MQIFSYGSIAWITVLMNFRWIVKLLNSIWSILHAYNPKKRHDNRWNCVSSHSFSTNNSLSHTHRHLIDAKMSEFIIYVFILLTGINLFVVMHDPHSLLHHSIYAGIFFCQWFFSSFIWITAPFFACMKFSKFYYFFFVYVCCCCFFFIHHNSFFFLPISFQGFAHKDCNTDATWYRHPDTNRSVSGIF